LSWDFLPDWLRRLTEGRQPGRGLFDHVDREDSVSSRILNHGAFQFAAFLAFIAALVAILTSGFQSEHSVPASIRVGQPAANDIEAKRTFTYTAPTGPTSQQADTTLPVFDWDEHLTDDIQQNLQRAFSDIRAAMRRELRTNSPETTAGDQPSKASSSGTSSSSNTSSIPAEFDVPDAIRQVPVEQRLAVARQLREQHFSNHLVASVPDTDFDTFAEYGFPAAVESSLTNLIRRVMSRIIVDGEELAQIDTERGIYLRRMRGEDVLVEYQLTNLDARILKLRNTPGVVRDAAPQLVGSLKSEQLRAATTSAAVSLVQPNTIYNPEVTEQFRSQSKQAGVGQRQTVTYRDGDIIVQEGQRITPRHIDILEQMTAERRDLGRLQAIAGTVVLTLLLLVTLIAFGTQNIREFRPAVKDIFFLGTTTLLMLLVTQLGVSVVEAVGDPVWLETTTWYYLIPAAAGGMLVRLVLNNAHAIIFTIVFSLLVGVVIDQSLFFVAYTMIGTLVGVASVQRVKRRMALIWSGLAVGGVNIISTMSFLLIQGEFFTSPTLTAGTAVIGFAGGLLSGLILSFVLPVFEAVFGYTTDIKLLELANLNHPLLRQLILRSPGSYHHSMMVGSLCEAAAEAVGANALLARVGAYYHDVGKAKNPQYFAENQKPGENPHDNLKPNMSALIIKSHVKDGLEMGRKHRLPQEILDFIAQHHGTSLIAYFYEEAKRTEDPDIQEVDEEDYRYPGPKPQTRETAICLLADGIEAASRAMPEPTPARLKGLVQKMINRAFTDGQLDECDLTLRDLDQIAKAMTRILTGIFHHRPEYPDEQPSESRSTANDLPSEEELDADEEAAESDADTDDTQESDDGDGDLDDSHSPDTSPDSAPDDDDSAESRGSLPRLGTE
jgi:putative nucleotidyltransferase with HDIG domain